MSTFDRVKKIVVYLLGVKGPECIIDCDFTVEMGDGTR